MTRPNPLGPSARRRGFSVIEMLIALTISSMLLTACLVALDSSFKAYEVTTESASTHVVSRMVMHRALAMIRQGEEFGPYPLHVLVPTKVDSPYIEFVSLDDEATGQRQVTRLERADDPDLGGYKLMYKRWDYVNGVQADYHEYPLIRDLKEALFTLEFDRGPRLRQVTIDLTIEPNDADPTHIASDLSAPVLRLIASTSPRKLD